MKYSHFFRSTKNTLLQRPIIAAFCVFVAAFLLLGYFYIYDTGDTALDDHFFHYKYASLAWEKGWDAVENFDWIYMNGISSEGIRYQINLYNYSLIPFTIFFDGMMGVKISDAFFASLFFATFYYILRKMRVKYPLFFTLILLSSSYFYMRMLAGRAYVLAIAFALLELHLAIRKKHRAFFLIAIVHVMWHQATFFIPILVTVISESARYLSENRWNIKNNLYGLIAVFFGMLIYSGFPYNIYLLLMNIFSVQEKAREVGSFQGVESMNKDFMYNFILSFELFAFVAIISSCIVMHYYLKNRSQSEKNMKEDKSSVSLNINLYAWFIFLIITVSGSLLVSGRLFDYYLPISIILFSLIVTVLYEKRAIIIDVEIKKILHSAVIIFTILLCFGTLLSVKKKFASFDHGRFKEAAEWIADRSNEKDRVYLDNWSHFTILFLYNDKNVYSTGLEPNDALQESPELYWKWHNFKRNLIYCEATRDCSDDARKFIEKVDSLSEEKREEYQDRNSNLIVKSIRDDFGARFIVSGNKTFNKVLYRSGDLFNDVLQVKDEKGKVVLEVFKIKDL